MITNASFQVSEKAALFLYVYFQTPRLTKNSMPRNLLTFLLSYFELASRREKNEYLGPISRNWNPQKCQAECPPSHLE